MNIAAIHNNKTRLHSSNSKLFLFIALLLTSAVYLPGLNGPFLLDDSTNTLQLKMTELNWEQLLSLSFSLESGVLRRPLANASFSLNFIFFGEEALSFKITNLVLHLFIGIVLYLVGKKILSHCLQDRFNEKQITSIALITAVIWLLHPLHVSTVLYVVQRMAQLSTLFTLLAVLSYIYGREHILQEKRFAYTIILLGYFIFGLLGMLSKETTALLPGYIFLIEMLVFRFRTPIAKTGIYDKRFLSTFGIIAVLPIMLGLSIYILKLDAFTSGYINREFSLGERLLTESHVLWDYIKQYFYPQLSGMALHNDGYPIVSSFNFSTILTVSGLLGLTITGTLLTKKEPIIALGIFWFLLSHTLESTVLPLELKFEHRNYTAMYGLLLASVYGFYRFTAFTRFILYAKVFLGIFILLLSYQTFNRASIWAEKEILVQFESRFQPNSFRLMYTLIFEDLAINDFASAREKTLLLRNARSWDASPAMIDIMIDCTEVASPTNTRAINSTRYVNESLPLIKNTHRLGSMPFTLSILNLMTTSGLCSNISAQELVDLYKAALANPRVTSRPIRQYNLLLQLARVYNSSGRTRLAISALEDAHSFKPKRLAALIEKGYIELNSGDLKNARLTVEQLKSLNDIQPFFRKHTSQIIELESFIQQEEMAIKH